MVLDAALAELAENHDLVETTDHRYLVGYLCKALAARQEEQKKQKRLKAWDAARAIVAEANVDGRDLVQELIDERRLEAARE